MVADSDAPPSAGNLAFALLSDPGTERQHNEDACGLHVEGPTSVLLVVADGVSGNAGGEVASQTAVDVTIRAYRESPASWGPAKRLHRAAQQANIEIHDRALIVTDLRRMATTLTAVVACDGIVHAAHVGDTRLYLVRDGKIVQKSQDHTLVAERVRLGMIRAKRAKNHPDRSVLTRSVGPELIAAIDRITFSLLKDDVLLVCSDGLYNVLEDEELRACLAGSDPASACRRLVDEANARSTADNVTAAVLHVLTETPDARPTGWRSLLGRWLGR